MAPINVFEYAASFEDILAGHCCSHKLLSSLMRPGIDCHSFYRLYCINCIYIYILYNLLLYILYNQYLKLLVDIFFL